MAADVVWLDQAKDDVRQLLDYLTVQDPVAALRYLDDIENGCAGLAEFPLQGRQYDERYRAIVIRSHLVFYRFDESSSEVAIVAVIDGRRDLPDILDSL